MIDEHLDGFAFHGHLSGFSFMPSSFYYVVNGKTELTPFDEQYLFTHLISAREACVIDSSVVCMQTTGWRTQ